MFHLFFLPKKPAESYFLPYLLQKHSGHYHFFKSGLQRIRLALIFNLDFTPFHQDKLMKVCSPLAGSSQAPLFYSSPYFRSGKDSCNPNCVTHCLYNYSRGYKEQRQPPKSHNRCQEKQIIYWQVYLSPLQPVKKRQYIRAFSMSCCLTSV